MKAFKKELNRLKSRQDAPVKEMMRGTAIFMVEGILLNAGIGGEKKDEEETKSSTSAETKVIGKRKTCNSHVYSKVVELSLQILFKAWKAWGFSREAEQPASAWPQIQDFTEKVTQLIK